MQVAITPAVIVNLMWHNMVTKTSNQQGMAKDTISPTTLHHRHIIRGIRLQLRRIRNHMLRISQLHTQLPQLLPLPCRNGNQRHLLMVRFTITTNEPVRLSGKSRWECPKEVWRWVLETCFSLLSNVLVCLLVVCADMCTSARDLNCDARQTMRDMMIVASTCFCCSCLCFSFSSLLCIVVVVML